MNEGTKKTLLLVEDEALIAVAGKQQLAEIGYSVEHVGTGEAAVAYALNPASRPDLILMDIDLGEGIDGTEAAREILNEIEIPVVFLSSHTEPEIVEKTEKITSYGYVVKNSGITVLDASIKMAFKLFQAKMQEQQHKTALLHSRDLMRYVIEHNRSAVAVHDRELNYIYVSKQYLDQFNVKERDIIGKHHYEVFPDLPQKFRDAHQRALRGEVSTGEDDPYERQDGTITWTRWECRPWYDSDESIGGLIVYTEVLAHEPSQRIKTRDTINYLRSILRTTRDGFCVVDMNGRFLDVNDAYCEMCGYSREEFLQLSIQDIAVDEHPELTAERLEYIRATGSALFQARDRRKDGTVSEVEVSASFLGGEEDKIVAFYRDISERIQAEEKLQLKSSFIDGISKVSPDLFITYDKAGVYLEIATANEDDLFLRREDLLGNKISEVLPEPATSIIMQGIDGALWTNSLQVIEYELPIGNITSNFEARILPLFDDKLLAQVINITERKRAEQEIQRQLAEKETLLKEVHHRIKNNMAQVEGLLSLQTESSDNPDVQAALREAMSRVQSMRVLYEKLLISTDYQDVSVKDYIESLVDSIIAVFPERANVTVEQKMGDFTLSSRKLIPVGIIINELLTNAFKYAFTGRAGGHVVIELDKTETHITLTVQDDGIGLHDGVVTNGSTGFGLTLVQMLAEQLNGTYTIGNDNGTKNVLELEA